MFYLAIFTVEMFAKIMAYGLIGHRGSYLRDPWCQLDFVVVSLAWAPIFFPWMGNFSALRSFRALRPLRALKRLPGMPVLVQSILSALPRVGGVIVLCGFVSLIFAIVGVELFKGSLHYRCALPGFDAGDHNAFHGKSAEQQLSFDSEISCNPSLEDQCPEGTVCEYFKQNPNDGLLTFDSVPYTFVILLQALTFDDWTVSMYAVIKAVSPYAVIYFLLFVILGGFFIVNLFLAVIFEEFISAQKTALLEAEDEALEAAQAKADADADANADADAGGRTILPTRSAVSLPDCTKFDWCQPPKLAFLRMHVSELVTSDAFNAASATVVVLNMVLMCMPYAGMSESYEVALDAGAEFFTLLFIIEMAVKIYGLGCIGYWSDGWNSLDGTIVSLNIVEMIIETLFSSGTGVNMNFLRIIRMLRILRVLRLMRSWKSLYKIVMTFGKALVLMTNLFLLMLIFMVIFSLLGEQIFGARFDPSTGFSLVDCPGGLCPIADLDPHPRLHFDYFVPAMLTVFTIMTGEWVDAMGVGVQAVGVKACLYYIGVVLVGRYLIMNLLIAIVLSAFSDEDDEAKEPPSPAPSHRKRTPITPSGSVPAIEEEAPAPDEVPLLEDSPVSLTCKRIVSDPYFENFIIVAIILSSACLALDSPRLDPESALAVSFKVMDQWLWPWLFLGELLLKVKAYGFVYEKDAYLTSPWNQLDFAIVLGSFASLAADIFPALSYMTNIRVLRVLRPLRLISRNEGMRLVLSSLFKSLPAVTNVLGVVFVIQVVFAIMGMQLYRGAMSSCTNPHLTREEDCFLQRSLEWSRAQNAATGHDHRQLKGGGGSSDVWDGTGPVLWLHSRVGSFDDFGSSMLLLYVMSTGDEWNRHMFTMMDSAGAGNAPKRFDSSPDYIFSVLWMFVGSFFAMNLFVGVIVDEFTKIKRESDGTATMTKEQQQWVNTMKAVVANRPIKVARIPSEPIRKFLYEIVTSDRFEMCVMTIIIGIIGVMSCDFWQIEKRPQPYFYFNKGLEYSAYFFYFECIIKILGLGVDGYFSDGWCRFDFALVCTTLLDQFASDLLAQIIPLPPMLLRVLRVIRILRILRLLKYAKDLRNLILTMIFSFPALMNVCGVLMLVTFMYAVLGVDLFTYVAHQDNLNDDRNFDTLANAGLLLFQCLTNDAWSGLMADAMATEERELCTDADGDCGSWVAVPYFISFQIIGSFVLLNLLVAIILENFTTIGSQDAKLVQSTDLSRFQEVWAEFDPDGDHFIPATDMPALILKLPPPLGFKGFASKKKAVRICVQLRVKLHAGQVAFQEVLDALINYNFKKLGHDPDAFFSELVDFIPPTPEQPPTPRVNSPEVAEGLRSLAEVAMSRESTVDLGQAFALDVLERYKPDFKRWKREALAENNPRGKGKSWPVSGAQAASMPPAETTKQDAELDSKEPRQLSRAMRSFTSSRKPEAAKGGPTTMM